MNQRATILSLTEDEATLKTEAGVTISLPKALLPTEAAAGQDVWLSVEMTPAENATPQAILNELLASDHEPS